MLKTVLYFVISLTLWGYAMSETKNIGLPPPESMGKISVEEAISRRRSCRNFSDKKISLQEISQLLWACQGITDSVRHFRAAPSAGATFPFETYLIAGAVDGIEPGAYRYNYRTHSLELIKKSDIRRELANACLSQSFIIDAPATIILAALYNRTTNRYGERGYRYVAIEAGHIGQNLHLQCESIGLGTVMIGAFQDDKVKSLLEIEEEPLYIMPVGKPE